MVEVGRGGTEQARWEREMIEGNIAQRLASLQLGDASLVFGRIDTTQSEGGDSFYIGRLAVADEKREPLVVDWRAPVAEPFYRATGRSPMGLVRRRHFSTRGRQLLAIEDELFGESSGLLGGELAIEDEGRQIRGKSTLIAALEEVRTGRLSDIVATIQGEQDEYGTMAQLDAIARQVKGRCELVKLANCGHSPHRDQPEETLRVLTDFIYSIA
jgi:DNA helicase IV